MLNANSLKIITLFPESDDDDSTNDGGHNDGPHAPAAGDKLTRAMKKKLKNKIITRPDCKLTRKMRERLSGKVMKRDLPWSMLVPLSFFFHN